MNLEFRVIEMEKREPWMIAAMDHAIFDEVEHGRSPATLVFHNWKKGISLASSQPLQDLDLATCKREGFPIVRLKTGGKAVVHFPDTEFSYSLFIPMDPLQRNPTKLYAEYCGKIANTLQSFGLPHVKVDNNDVWVGDKKIAGNAMHLGRPDSKAVVQQGLILYKKPSASAMIRLMAQGMYPLAAVNHLDSMLTGFRNYSSASMDEFQKTLKFELTNGQNYSGELSQNEKDKISSLEDYYKSPGLGGTLTSGLCWLPAPEYIARKRIQQEVEQSAKS
jgi:lipoate-protein ligase A